MIWTSNFGIHRKQFNIKLESLHIRSILSIRIPPANTTQCPSHWLFWLTRPFNSPIYFNINNTREVWEVSVRSTYQITVSIKIEQWIKAIHCAKASNSKDMIYYMLFTLSTATSHLLHSLSAIILCSIVKDTNIYENMCILFIIYTS